jgi:hypothetical protein
LRNEQTNSPDGCKKKVNKGVFLELCAINFFFPIFASSMGIGGETGGGKKIFGTAVKPKSR